MIEQRSTGSISPLADFMTNSHMPSLDHSHYSKGPKTHSQQPILILDVINKGNKDKSRHYNRGLNMTTAGQHIFSNPTSPASPSIGSIPTKNQRIIINKDALKKGGGIKKHALQTHNVLPNVSLPSIQSPKSIEDKSLLNQFLQPSNESLVSKLSTADQSEIMQFMRQLLIETGSQQSNNSNLSLPEISSENRYSHMSPKNAVPFGSSASRSDLKYDLKLLFNKDPGPGSYKTPSKLLIPNLDDIDTDTIITLNELKNKINTQSSHNISTEEIQQNINQLSKLQDYFASVQKKRLENSHGPKFTQANRFKENQSYNQSPGPAHYSPQQENGSPCQVLMQSDQKIKIPYSIQNNPLNYIKPLVVNLYYKTPNPGVGQYDVTIPEEIGRSAQNPQKYNYKSTFESKEQRFQHQIAGDKEIIMDERRENDFYNIQESYEAQEKVKRQMPSNLFRRDRDQDKEKEYIPKVLEEIKEENKISKPFTNIYLRDTIEESVQNAKLQSISQAMSGNVNTHDRFGDSILPRAVVDMKPGPGNYETVDPDKVRPTRNYRGTLISPISDSPNKRPFSILPGPSSYDVKVPHKHLSYHFWPKNASPAMQKPFV